MFEKLFASLLRLLGIRSKTKIKWPAKYRAETEAEMDKAKAVVRHYIGKVKTAHGSISLYVVPAQRHFSGRPAIWQPDLSAWVHGWASYSGGHAEAHVAEWSAETMFHECAHVECFSRRVFGHDPRLDAHVPGWRTARRITGVMHGAPPAEHTRPTSMEWEAIGPDGKSTHYHADGIVWPHEVRA